MSQAKPAAGDKQGPKAAELHDTASQNAECCRKHDEECTARAERERSEQAECCRQHKAQCLGQAEAECCRQHKAKCDAKSASTAKCPRRYTLASGAPVTDDQNSVSTPGEDGYLLLQNIHLIEKLAHFDRERIPERVVHAKGGGAHGYFEVTHDFTKICKAKFLSEVGKRTEIFSRFSTVAGELGSADSVRDPRGFSVKFYTEEGNWDMVGNNTPIFFIRDPIQFPDFIHTQKRDPQTHLKDPNMFWDFLSLVPESVHQVTILFSDRGYPKSFRFMDGFSSHTLKVVDGSGGYHWVKWHFKTDQGILNNSRQESEVLAGTNPDYAIEDLFSAIKEGSYPSWTVYLQVMRPDQVDSCSFNPFDLTKVWPHGDFPMQEIGKLVLNRNPLNYFAEVEQAAFSPANMVPGIEPSPDKMLQGRLFSYGDAHRYRLGPNFEQIPINCPLRTGVYTHQRDSLMAVNGNGGNAPNYFPNSCQPAEKDSPEVSDVTKVKIRDGHADHHRTAWPNQDDFVQAGNLYRLMPQDARQRLVDNIVDHLSNCRKEIQARQVEVFRKADPEYGRLVEQGLEKESKKKEEKKKEEKEAERKSKEGKKEAAKKE